MSAGTELFDWEVKRTSPRTGKENTIIVRVSSDQVESYMSGTLIQNAFPQLSSDEREFIMTGYTKEDWDAMFPEEEA